MSAGRGRRRVPAGGSGVVVGDVVLSGGKWRRPGVRGRAAVRGGRRGGRQACPCLEAFALSAPPRMPKRSRSPSHEGAPNLQSLSDLEPSVKRVARKPRKNEMFVPIVNSVPPRVPPAMCF